MNTSQNHTKQRPYFSSLLMLVAIILLFFLDITIGSVSIPIDQVLSAIFMGETEKSTWLSIIWQFRMPKAFTAILVGAGLGVSGLQMQTLFRNPLAGPYVLGISSGASLGVALVVLASYSFGGFLTEIGVNNWTIVISSSVGSSLVLVAVLMVSNKVKDSMTLLIIGLMFGSITGAFVSVLQFFSESKQLQIYLIWTFGSLSGLGWSELYILSLLVGTGLFITVYLIKPLNGLLLSENYAQSMGIGVKKTRRLIVISTSLLAGSITAFCGPIAFVGLAVPHIARVLYGTSNHKTLLPATIMLGIIVMLACDIASQLPGSEHVLPINAITSLLGGPMVIWIIISKGGVKKSFSG